MDFLHCLSMYRFYGFSSVNQNTHSWISYIVNVVIYGFSSVYQCSYSWVSYIVNVTIYGFPTMFYKIPISVPTLSVYPFFGFSSFYQYTHLSISYIVNVVINGFPTVLVNIPIDEFPSLFVNAHILVYYQFLIL